MVWVKISCCDFKEGEPRHTNCSFCVGKHKTRLAINIWSTDWDDHVTVVFMLRYLVFLHGILKVIVNARDEMCIESSQGKQYRGGGRGSKRIHMPWELRTHPKRLIQEAVTLWNSREVLSYCGFFLPAVTKRLLICCHLIIGVFSLLL